MTIGDGRSKVRWESRRLHGGAGINCLILRQSYLLPARISYQLSVLVFVKGLTASSIRLSTKVPGAHGLDRCPLAPLNKIMWAPVVDPVANHQ